MGDVVNNENNKSENCNKDNKIINKSEIKGVNINKYSKENSNKD